MCLRRRRVEGDAVPDELWSATSNDCALQVGARMEGSLTVRSDVTWGESLFVVRTARMERVHQTYQEAGTGLSSGADHLIPDDS